MAEECLFYAPEITDIELGNSVSRTVTPGTFYQISNIQHDFSEIYAPEINLYAYKSCDKEKGRGVNQLYRGKLALLEAMQTVELSTTIGRRLLLLGEELSFLEQFEVIQAEQSELEYLKGYRGNFRFSIAGEEQIVDQIVWNYPTPPEKMFDGLILAKENSQLLKQLEEGCGPQKYHNYIRYNRKLCANSPKSKTNCTLCLTSCPTESLSWQKDGIHIHNFSCTNCGNCISHCPSGALEFTTAPRHVLAQIGTIYRGKNILVFDKSVDLATIASLPENCLPLYFDSLHFLDESYLFSLLYSCGKSCAIYGEIGPQQHAAIELINAISRSCYQKDSLTIIPAGQERIELSFTDAKLPTPFAQAALFGVRKREIFSLALNNSIPKENIRIATSAINYGELVIDQERCTLCLGCAEICHTGALTVHPEDNTLRCNPSLCAQCGNCQQICPENALQLMGNSIPLTKDYCRETIRAQDELYACSKCGVQFAPRRAIERVMEQMSPLFANDPLKLSSLSCCPECKAKLMLESLSAQKTLSR